MFRKNKDATPTTRSKAASPSVISKDMHVLGTIVSDGMVDCDGTIDGNVRCHTLTVRESGVIKGDVTADTVLVYGKINGLIRAKTVQLFATCHIEGIVMHESLSIEDGAFIDGKCKRTDKPLTAKPEDDSSSDIQTDDEGGDKIKVLENIRLIR